MRIRIARKKREDETNNENVLPLPTFAFPTDEHTWRIFIHGYVYKNKQRKLKRRLLLNVLRRLLEPPHEELNGELFEQRIAPFFSIPCKGRRIRVALGECSFGLRRKSRRNGRFRDKLDFSNHDLAAALGEPSGAFVDPSRFPMTVPIRYLATNKTGSSESSHGQVRLIPRQGLSVISDIDDTIKDSQVENRSELLANTFLREFRVFEGMAKVFREWAEAGAEFHYVTASPWQLVQPLVNMLQQFEFPLGSLHPRTSQLGDHLLKRLGLLHRGGKAGSIRRILNCFPQRRFVMVGDSGEKDLEIYSRFFKSHPNQVVKILIRLVRPEHRYRESILRGNINLPPGKVELFENAEQLRDLLDLKNEPGALSFVD